MSRKSVRDKRARLWLCARLRRSGKSRTSGEDLVMQRIDHVMDGLLLSVTMCAPIYLLYKIGLFLIE